MYVILKTLTGVSILFGFNVAFVIASEIVGPKYEFYSSLVFAAPWTFGYMLLSGVGYYFRTWRAVEGFLSILCIPTVIGVFIMPESPRWLISKKKFFEAKQVFEKMVKFNRSVDSIDDKIIVNIEKIEGLDDKREKSSVFTLFQHGWKMITITLMLTFTWFSISIGFYGLGLGAAQMPGVVFFTNFMNGVADLMCFPIFVAINRNERNIKVMRYHIKNPSLSLLQ